MNKNHGLNLELEKAQQKEQDWIFGAGSISCIAQIPNDQRDLYLPVGEIQRGADDTMDCASRAPVNISETKFNWLVRNKKLPASHMKFLKDNGYITPRGDVEVSDAFIAINSGTTRQGNSLIAPLEAIRKHGLIPKKMLPLVTDMTFDQYHDPARITAKMKDLGQQFLRFFHVNYERVLEEDFAQVLINDMIDVGGFAWSTQKDGIYPRTNRTPNHAFVIYKAPKYWAFDNYLDVFDDDFVKHLADDYDLIDFGYRLIFSLGTGPTKSRWQRFIDALLGR